MAEVTGQIGQDEVVLNNAATEATLKQLLSAMQAIAAKQGAEIKNDKELDKQMQRLGKQTQEQVRGGRLFKRVKEEEAAAAKKNAEATDEAAEELGAFAESTQKSSNMIGKGLNLFMDGLNKVSSALGSAAGMSDSISSATGALGQIPLGIGDTINAVFGPPAAAADRVHDAFIQAASSGANFGGNILEMTKTASEMGMTFEQLGGIVNSQAENLMFLGGSVSQGAKRLGEMSKLMRDSQLGAELQRLGFSSADINENLAAYSGRLARTGRSEELTNRQLVELSGKYMKNLDAVSKLTGKSKEALQAEEDARMADAQYRIMMSKLSEEERIEMEKLMSSIPKAHQTGLKEILATGTATSDEGVKAMAFLNKTGQSAQSIFQQIQSGQGLQEGFANDFYNTYAAEAKKFAESPIGETLGKFDDTMKEFYVGSADVAARNKTLGEIQAETEAEQEALKNKIAANTGEVLDPETIAQFKRDVAEAGNNFATALASVDLSKLKSIFETASQAAMDYLVPAIELAAENFDKVVTSVVAAKVSMLALAAATTAATAAQAARGFMVGDGGGKDKNKKNKKDKKGGGSGAAAAGGGSKFLKGLAKRVPYAGLAYGAYEGYSAYTEADAALAAGEITENQATVAKSGAVGTTAGGLGGAAAGAAAGALAGSVVPVVGTAIGGLVGGAIGYWAGSAGGEAVGEMIGEELAGPDTVRDLQAKIAEVQDTIAGGTTWTNWSLDDEKEKLEKLQAQLAKLKTANAEIASRVTTASGASGTLTDEQAKEVEDYLEKTTTINEDPKVPGTTATSKGMDDIQKLNSNVEAMLEEIKRQTIILRKNLGLSEEATSVY